MTKYLDFGRNLKIKLVHWSRDYVTCYLTMIKHDRETVREKQGSKNRTKNSIIERSIRLEMNKTEILREDGE